MGSVLRSEELRQDLIERGFRRASDFSWRKNACELVQVFEAVRAERPRGSGERSVRQGAH
jgi:hypothetical protein